MTPKQILVVEDEALVALDIADRLLTLGYQCAGRIDNGAETLQRIAAQRPDLVLMDIRLKGDMDGIAAAEEIRRRFHLPVIFLTAYSEDEILNRAKQAAPFGYILKPFDDRELKSTIEIALYRHHTEEEIRNLNRLYDVLSQVNQAVVRIRQREELLAAICRLMVERGEMDLTWFGRLDPASSRLIPTVYFGRPAEILNRAAFYADVRPEGLSGPGLAFREERPVVCNGCLSGSCPYPADQAPSRFGFQSCAFFPIRFQGRIWGTLNLCTAKPGFFQEREITLLQEVAGDISFALDNIAGDRLREELDQQLQQQLTFLQTLLDALPFPVFYKGERFRFLGCNQAYETFFGFSRDQLVGRTVYDLWPRVLADCYHQNDLKVMDSKAPCVYEAQVETIPQGRRFVQFHKAFFLKPEGQVGGIIGALEDITDRKKEEEEKSRLEAQLFQAQKMESVGRLAGGVAHDFNNMLGAIIGYTDLALDGMPSDSPNHENLQEVRKAAFRSADLTRQLLAFARQQPIKPQVLDLNDTISSLLKMLRRLIGEDIDLAWLPGHDLWKVRLDPSQIDQILANLVVNARDAISGTGIITLKTENVPAARVLGVKETEFTPGDYVLLTVADTGTGMNREVLEHLFEPFFSTKETGKGTGLGLATVYGVTKQNNGFITVDSAPGKGAVFNIYLPRFEEKILLERAEKIEKKVVGGTETILLVEDERAILNLSRTILENLGYTVLAAGTPLQAIQLAQNHPGEIDLIITDVVMPEMSGRELVGRLLDLRPGLKNLYMSGYTAEVIAHRGVLDEGVHFIAKPFSRDELAEKIRTVLDGET
ncbi:MAG: response regulator [Deltaproteobacteria bacterium]|nr:response regulator [Deltaproteobacteria bacterium]